MHTTKSTSNGAGVAVQAGTKNLQVIKASAGAGKTFTLAKLYIERLLWDQNGNLRKHHGNYHQHILAITFTNKATAEMKERIIIRLHELAQGKCTAYQGEFLKKYPGTTLNELKAAAKAALEDILFDYTAFNVSTIDSFFQTVLRTFVYELDREYDYELQLDSTYATRQAVQNLMNTVGTGDKNEQLISKWVKEYLEYKLDDSSDWNVFGGTMITSLVDFAKELGNEDLMKHHDEIRDYLSDVGSGEGVSRLGQFKKALVDAKIARENQESNFKNVLLALFNKHGVSIDCLTRSATLRKVLVQFTKASLGSSVKTISSYVENEATLAGNFAAPARRNNPSIEGKLVPAIQEKIKDLVKLWSDMDFLKDIIANLWKLGLLGKIDEYMEKYRKDNNLILISDTADLIAKVLESGVPFLYERMGVWLNHFMIDEFQDTSHKQYDNFKPLLLNSLAQGYLNLTIGDEKQCIYRFRNSDPELFQSILQKEFSGHYDGSFNLDTNFRSSELVVEFNNKFFRNVLKHDEIGQKFAKLQQTYEHLEQKTSSAAQESAVKGFVKLKAVYGKPTGKEKNKPYFYKEGEEKYYGKEGVLKALPAYILEQHERFKYPFGKILVLVNTNAEGNDVVESILEHNQKHPERLISIVSAESLLLRNSAAVRMIISVLRFLNSTQFTQDEDSGESIDHSNETLEQKMQRKRLREQLYYHTLHEYGKALAADTEGKSAGTLLAEVFGRADELRSKPVDEQIAIFTEKMKALLPDANSEQSNLVAVIDKIVLEYLQPIGLNQGAETSFILALQGYVLEFCSQRSNGGTIYEFLKWWDVKEDKLAIAAGQNADAVEVMTVHKAKGLERPCVIVPFANWEMVKTDSLTWLPREQWISPEFSQTDNKENGKPFFGIADKDIVPPLVPVGGTKLTKYVGDLVFSNQLREDCLIDSLNKTYVAFTRPRQALHIFAEYSNQPKYNTINDFLFACFPKKEAQFEEVMSKQEGSEKYLDFYSLGKEEKYEGASEQASAEEVEMVPDYTVTPLDGKLKVKLPELMTESQESGKQMHRVMSRVHTAADIDRVLRYAERRGILTDEGGHYWTKTHAEEFLRRVVADEATAARFAKGCKVMNERSIYIPAEGSHDASHMRPDRIVHMPDGRIVVIDYKFGDTPVDEQHEGYVSQVQGYCRILSKMWQKPVEGYLLYAKEFKVEKVD
ncbi:MAG: UvrD-helicase domain-containing protein [Bacteroidales bacterium]|nr:UvrD-helicase domain-containing protein [Bacteroidales bacterium]